MADPPPIPPATDLALRRYTTVMAYMGTECSMFWSRSQLFLVANSALIGFLAKDIPLPGAPQNLPKLWIYLSLSVAGLALCTLWHIMIHVGSRWIDWWQLKMSTLEPDAYDSTVLWRQRPSTGPWKARDVARATAVLFTIIWLGLFIYILCLFTT
jgi:hypothetical protein